MYNFLDGNTFEDILSRLLQSVSDLMDKRPGSMIYDLLAPSAVEFAFTYMQMQEILNKLDVDNLEQGELDAFVKQRTGIIRKPATKATTFVTITGVPGSLLRVGDLVASDTVTFRLLTNSVITESRLVSIEVECTLPGVIGNVLEGAINSFPLALLGITSVINPHSVNTGYAQETDDELRIRYYERIRTPATSGNKYHYMNWAKEVPGVGDAKVFSLWNGANTVKIVVIDSSKQPASAELVEMVQNYIDPGIQGLGEGEAPIGAFATVISAIAVPTNISLTLTRNLSVSLEQVKASIIKNITQYLKETAFKSSIVSYARLGAIILESDGVLDYTNLLINGAASNVAIEAEQVPTMGEVVAIE